jgi:hypothetical protein
MAEILLKLALNTNQSTMLTDLTQIWKLELNANVEAGTLKITISHKFSLNILFFVNNID